MYLAKHDEKMIQFLLFEYPQKLGMNPFASKKYYFHKLLLTYPSLLFQENKAFIVISQMKYFIPQEVTPICTI